MEIRLTAIAEQHAERIDKWWRKNRPSAPDLFSDELRAVLALLSTAPDAGETYKERGLDASMSTQAIPT